MLGDKLGEASGQITGVRVLSRDKVEVSFQGRGQLLGRDIADVGTYWQTIRSPGVFYGEGQVIMTTAEGGVLSWTGFGVGKPTGPTPAARYGVAGSFHDAPEGLARLTTVATAIEYEVDAEGNYQWQAWEWT